MVTLCPQSHLMRSTSSFYIGLAVIGLAGSMGHGAWSDRTAGMAWVEHHSARELGTDPEQWVIGQDKLGRLFVGGVGLLVFDGQSWKPHSIGKSYAVRTLLFGENGRLWTAGLNEIGYLTEPSIGDFHYHSLLEHLPEKERLVGHIWGSGLVGSHVYFIGKERLYGWDGTRFRLWNFPGESRLFPLKLGEETWFHHRETGLYRLTETGPKLELDRSQLPDTGILGLTRDSGGLLLVSNNGFYRPGSPLRMEFGEDLNRYITEHRLSAYERLPDGIHLVGTLNGGLVVVSPEGRILRIIDGKDHPAAQIIFSIFPDANGQIWCTTNNGIFRIEPRGTVTLFNSGNGLEGGPLGMEVFKGQFYLSMTAGMFRLGAATIHAATVERLPQFKESYRALTSLGDALLLGRHGGLDIYDGSTIKPVYSVLAKGVFFINPSRFPPGSYVVSEGYNLARLRPREDGSLERQQIISFPDHSVALAEDAAGRILIGTTGQGAFVTDPDGKIAQPVLDPETGTPITGYTCLSNLGSDLLVFADQRVLRLIPGEAKTKQLLSLPGIMPKIALAMDGGTLLAYKRTGSAGSSAWGQGLGVITLGPNGEPEWHELQVPALDLIGFVQTMKLLSEEGRSILWLGGTEGMLRLDYEAIAKLQPPSAPFIKLDALHSSQPAKSGALEFPFTNQRLGFQIFTGDYTRSKDWLIQTRFGQNGSEWSAASTRRSYEFSNLSEGNYRFEVRAVNAAGMTSEPAVFSFRILPPWYRSNGAYAGYAIALVLGVWGLIRFRERQIRTQNEKLETQVQVRTEELVKANAAKDEFLAGVSHEIRNPMNGVIGISESLKTTGLDQESRRKFGLLRQCASHLSSLLEDILDISKVQAGVIELDAKPFDLPELVDAVAAMAAADSEKYGIPVEIAISPAVPRRLVGDARRIRQILLNFVSNALKFSGRGQVNVTVWCKAAPTPARTEVIFAVSDDGPGISAEEQKRLFTRFERGAAAQQGRVPGTGLGLALCKGFAEKMGGRIWLESKLDHGSSFYFSAPFDLAPESDDSTPPVETTAGMGEKLALVVDDQEYNRIVLVDLLAKLGVTALSASDGTEALALAGRKSFDFIFLDYDLPGLSGLEVSRGIRAMATGSARAHILATTAFSTPEKQAQCLAAGMNAFLGKPVTTERLRKALAAATGETVTPAPTAPSVDGMANLRLLATKKKVRFEEELALYLSELQLELDELGAAVHDEDTPEAAHYAHLLCGRCSFIYERALEQLLRQMEETVARGHWPEARQQWSLLLAQAAELRVRLVSSVPAAPPA